MRNVLCGVIGFWLATRSGVIAAEVDFSRDIRPLLSDRCFACHGPEESNRQGGFRLDRKESALGEADSGERPIVPGDPGASELYRRIRSDDEGSRMPPPDSNKSLSAEEIELIRRWIEEGAAWREHWALVPPRRSDLPEVSQPDWCRDPIDRFILARLDREKLRPSPEADKPTLIRRVTLDLTGLPPTLEEVDTFLSDSSPQAYERVVDRLLASPRYGEHMARFWLDAARYGDTHGLHLDNYREMWPYRDWVVRSFNRNQPFDEFTIEQLAGDLLPDPTLDQVLATGFIRCHVTTNEGGAIPEEVEVRNVVDRVVTTGTVFMGMTFDCTRCHDHKYDPFTTKDFYSLYAFFNSLDGSPMDGNAAQHPPIIKVPSPEQVSAQRDLTTQIDRIKSQIAEAVARVEYDESADAGQTEQPERKPYVWIEDAVPSGATSVAEGQADGQWVFVSAPQPVFSGERAAMRTAQGRSQHFFHQAPKGLRTGKGDTLFAHVYLDPANPPREIMLQWNTGDWKHRAYWGENLIDWGTNGSTDRLRIGELPQTGTWVRLEVAADQVGIKPGTVIRGWAFTQYDGTVYWDHAGVVTETPQEDRPFASLSQWVRAQRAAGADLAWPVNEIIKLDRDKRDEEQRRQLREYFIQHAYAGSREVFEPLNKELEESERKLAEVEKQFPTSLVFRERREPDPAYILHRGEYDQPREQVERAVPAVFPPFPDEAPRDRLGLARWLVDRSHPLTARVSVNRFWQQLFGTGMVKTAEDFGSQGQPPSHPELLDWLAVAFIDDGWDVKALMKRMVMSATYRQSSYAAPQLVRRDPGNRLLARGPRFRLDAETLRDQALAVSGLLVRQMGGPGVKPPQPDLWFAVGYSGSNTVRFVPDTEPEKVHRRTLYTFIKRTAPPPQMGTLDAPSRESCSVRRERTNTPLQALMLLNDPQYFEAACALAERVMREGGRTPAERAAFGYRLCTARTPDESRHGELVGAYRDLLEVYRRDPAAARKVIAASQRPADESLDPSELAAWTLVANLLLNLDGVLNKN